MGKTTIRKNDKRLTLFVRDIRQALLNGQRHQIAGFGTFSTCERKATANRAACKIAMFRASKELREYASGGALPPVSGPHALIVKQIISAMLSEQGIDIPLLGRMAVERESSKNPKLIFHGADELNNAL